MRETELHNDVSRPSDRVPVYPYIINGAQALQQEWRGVASRYRQFLVSVNCVVPKMCHSIYMKETRQHSFWRYWRYG